MNQNLTEIIAIIDKSGSMSSLTSDVIGGLNTFVESQKALPGECNFTLVLFDSVYKTSYSGAIAYFNPLTPSTYAPSGMTAMFDAIGNAIDTTGARLAAMDESARPGKVIVCILTDGDENSSKEYRGSQIKEKIKVQTDVYSWEFLFLGANIDTSVASDGIGIDATNNSASFLANSRGISNAFACYSSATTDLRINGSYSTTLTGYMTAADLGIDPVKVAPDL